MILCLILSIVLMAFDARYGHLYGLRQGLDTALTPLKLAVNLPFALYDIGKTQWQSRQELITANENLRRENVALRTRQQRLEIIERENQRLNSLLGSTAQIAERSLVAKLLTVALEPYSQQITLDKGSFQNVYVGQPIISAQGIMGQVIATSGFTSTALLITDAKHDIPVQSNRSGLRTIARGTGRPNELALLYIPNNADIKVGDLMISSGFGGRFPRNYPVATVTHISKNLSMPFATVLAQPTAHVDRASEVLLIWHSNSAVDLSEQMSYSDSDMDSTAPDKEPHER